MRPYDESEAMREGAFRSRSGPCPSLHPTHPVKDTGKAAITLVIKEHFMKPILTLRAALPVALAALALLSGPATAQMGAAPTTATPEPNVALSRDDVMRDLAAWKQSGVERNWNSDNTPDINSPEYVASYRKYVETVRPATSQQMQSQTRSPGKW